jgi:hypothetical protein
MTAVWSGPPQPPAPNSSDPARDDFTPRQPTWLVSMTHRFGRLLRMEGELGVEEQPEQPIAVGTILLVGLASERVWPLQPSGWSVRRASRCPGPGSDLSDRDRGARGFYFAAASVAFGPAPVDGVQDRE